MGHAKKAVAKARVAKTPGTIMAEQVRAEANTLTDAEREALMAHAMRAIYDDKSVMANALRR